MDKINSILGENIRKIASRWVITGDLELLSATCMGGNSESISDTPVLRDSITGLPLMPGSTLAGALRNHLARLGLKSFLLFGGEKTDPAGDQSPLIIFDSVCQHCAQVELRDGVKINESSGIAQDNSKYDFEVIPAGSKFPMRFDLLVSDERKECELICLLNAVLQSLASGEIFVGIKKTRGLGRLGLENCRLKRFNLNNERECLEWLTSDYSNPLSGDPALAPGDLPTKFSEIIKAQIPKLPVNTPRIRFTGKFALPDGILIRTPGVEADSPDSVHLVSGKKPLLSGTSIAGSLRHQSLKIANFVRKTQSDGKAWIDRVFGPEIRKGDKKGRAKASRLRPHESPIEEGEEIRVARIQIDRFTQGVYPGALFDEQIHRGGKVDIVLNLITESDAERGLFMLIIKDLLAGQIYFGGTSSIGRGKVTPLSASLELSNSSEDIKFENLLDLKAGEIEKINAWIKSFWNADALSIAKGKKND